MGFWLIVAFILLLLAVLPWWPHSRRWGWRPSMGVLLLGVLLILLFALRVVVLD